MRSTSQDAAPRRWSDRLHHEHGPSRRARDALDRCVDQRQRVPGHGQLRSLAGRVRHGGALERVD